MSAPDPVRSPGSIRLYVLDGGTLEAMDPRRFGLVPDEVESTRMPSPCFLITHPAGNLVWEAGIVPDRGWIPTGGPVEVHVDLRDTSRRVTMVRSIGSQLAEIGLAADDVSHLAFSHYHYDHTANASLFARALWLVRPAERVAMFAASPPPLTQPEDYRDLGDRPILSIGSTDHDVFGDGSVVIKATGGHTPGHQVLSLRLGQTGNVVLSGDLYHYAEERAMDRLPDFEFDAVQSRASMVGLEAFLDATQAQLWIQHDAAQHASRRTAPDFYD